MMILLRSSIRSRGLPLDQRHAPLTEPGLTVLRTAPELRKTWCRVPEREAQDRGVRFPFVKHTVPLPIATIRRCILVAYEERGTRETRTGAAGKKGER